MKYAILVVALCVSLAGCKSPFGTTNISNKTVHYHEHSINLHPIPTTVSEVEGETETGTEMVMPDGSYVTLTGGGAAGNLMLVTNQNDGTDQTTKTDAKASASANVNSPNSTADTGEATTENPPPGPVELEVVGR